MALVEGCKHELEISIPGEAVEQENKKVTEQFQAKAQLKGFRAGKAPLSLIRKSFSSDIRQKVLENLIPKFLDVQIKAQHLHVVGTPNVSDVHFHDGEAVHFKAQFEVFPVFEIDNYRGVEVPYADPAVADEDVDKRLEELRDVPWTRGEGQRQRRGRGRS